MQKRIKHLALCLTILTFVTILSGCSSSLSGRYVSQLGAGYIEFQGKEEVTIYDAEGDYPLGITGTYKVSGDKLVVTFDFAGSKSEVELKVDKSKNTISYNYHDFVKESDGSVVSSIPWWGWCLIVIFALGIINMLYKKITKRSLEEDLDKLEDKIEEKFDE